MSIRNARVWLLVTLSTVLPLVAARSAEPEKPAPAATTPAPPATGKDPADTDQLAVSHHQISLTGRSIQYTATAGMMPLKSAAGEVEARMFYTAYTLDGAAGKRPLLFAFNGGPGAASVWLHLGAIGPRRIKLLPDGKMPPPPFELVDNESTWLDQADLVFIDPVGTGYSAAVKPENNKNYWGVQQDISAVAEFIRLYLGRNERWGSPLYIAGESYGTFRAAGLAGALTDRGITLSGILLVSSVLNFRTISFANEDDLSYTLYLPTYAATAWYHHRLPADLQGRDLASVLEEVERWSSGEYLQALMKGDRLTGAERTAVLDRLVRYSGLSRAYLESANLRVSSNRFYKELLRDRKRTVGRYDSRYTGIDSDAAGEDAEYDPSQYAVQPVFTMTFNQYVRGELGFRTDRDYKVLASVYPWDWGRQMGYAETVEALRSALVKNPYLRVFVAEGLYDLATPYYGAEYTVSHLGLDPSVRPRVTSGQYPAGHMMYTDTPSREKLKRDVTAFIQGRALGAERAGR